MNNRGKKMYRIMLIDDEENILKALQRVLHKQKDWEVEAYNNGADAFKRAQVASFDLFLSDFRMPEMDGVEFLSKIKELQPDSMRFILSGFTDLDALLGAINKANIFRFISKPWDDSDLIVSIKQALELRDVIIENRILADEVRRQKEELDKRKKTIDLMQTDHPDLFEVNWSDDGSIIIDESNLNEQ